MHFTKYTEKGYEVGDYIQATDYTTVSTITHAIKHVALFQCLSN